MAAVQSRPSAFAPKEVIGKSRCGNFGGTMRARISGTIDHGSLRTADAVDAVSCAPARGVHGAATLASGAAAAAIAVDLRKFLRFNRSVIGRSPRRAVAMPLAA